MKRRTFGTQEKGYCRHGRQKAKILIGGDDDASYEMCVTRRPECLATISCEVQLHAKRLRTTRQP